MDVLCVVVAGAAVALGLTRAVMSFRRHIDDAGFARIAVDLIARGDIERARKLCRVAPHATLVAMTAKAIDATCRVDADLGSSTIEGTIRESMADELAARSGHSMWMSPLGVLLGALGVMLAMLYGDGAVQFAVVPSGIGLACGVYATLIDARVRSEARRHTRAIVDALVDHIMDATAGAPARPARSTQPETEVAAISQSLGLRPIRDVEPVPRGGRRSSFDMRGGECGMCGHGDIATVVREPLKAYVCKSCGFAQWFADDPSSLDV